MSAQWATTPAVWRMWAGVLVGMVLTPGAVLLPAGRMLRATRATAWAESLYDPDALGDAGASVGILQFNSVNQGLVSGQWRRSPYLSGIAAVRYVARASARQVWALLAPGQQGLNAWRAYWRTGSPFTAPTDGGTWVDISAGPWGPTPWSLLTVLQYAVIIAVVGAVPWLAVPYLLGGLAWAVLSGRGRV